MVQQTPMTDKERFDMYMKSTKKELASMLAERDKSYDRLTAYVVAHETSCNNWPEPILIHTKEVENRFY